VRKLDGSNKLDLHGARHYEVDRLVENFILMNQNLLPLTIVCGNSQRMIDLAYAAINRIECREVCMDRYGVISIRLL
jgi:hypothetical protein